VSSLSDPFWGDAAKYYNKVVRVPVWNEQAIWEKFANYAAQNQMGTNSVFMGRVDQQKIERSNQQIKEALAQGKFDPNTLYSSYDSPGGKIKQGIYSHINTIWNESRLNVIFGMIEEIIQTTAVDIRSGLVNSLNNYMSCIDMLTFNLITNL
jgi:hypothetical protein